VNDGTLAKHAEVVEVERGQAEAIFGEDVRAGAAPVLDALALYGAACIALGSRLYRL
jgi:hypothetical protein